MGEVFTATIIHLVTPLAGLLTYILIARKMIRDKVKNPPIIDLFLIFATYGGLLLVILTVFFWEWSGMASLGAFYLIFGAPIIMVGLGYKNFKNKHLSRYHLMTSRAGLLYLLIAPLTLLILLTFANN